MRRAAGRVGPDELDDDLKAFGISGATAARPQIESFGVYAHNWPAFQLWGMVWRQWRWLAGGFGAQRLGLDWCQVEAVMRMQGARRKDQAQRLAELKVMEDAALAELAEMDQLRGG